MALTLTGGNLNGGRELGRISGPLLSADLRRNGVNLAVDTDKLYLNVTNKYVGFGTNTPTRTLTAPGNSRFARTNSALSDLIVTTQADIGNLTFNNTDKIQNFTNNNITISPAAGDQLITFNGLGSTGYFAFLNNSLTGTTNTEINISPTGKTIIGSTTPAASLGFSGSNYLSLSDAQTIGTQAFTFECFFYSTGNFSSAIQTILGANAPLGMSIFFLTSSIIQVDRAMQDAITFTVPTMSTNTWYHLAVTRDSSGQTALFLNGVKSVNSYVTATDYSGTTGYIGWVYNTAYNFIGQLTQIKLTVGSNYYDPVAASISVPTTALTTSANTKLLLIVATSGAFLTDISGTQTISNIDGVTFSTSGPFSIQQNTGVLIDGTLHAVGNITFDGNITLGNDDTDNITFAADVNSDLIPQLQTGVISGNSDQLTTEDGLLLLTEDDQNLFTDSISTPYVYNLGSGAKKWNNVYSQNLAVTDLFSTTATAGTWNQGGLVITGNSVSAGTGTLNITISGTGKVNLHNKVYIKDNTITHNNAIVPLEIGATGVGYTKFGGTRGLVIPKGTTLQRPAAAELGTMRYNSDVNYIEVYANVSNTQVVSLSTNSVTATAGATQIFTTNTVGFNVGDFISSTSDLLAFAGGTIITAVATNTSVTINTPLLNTLTAGSNLTSQRKWIPIIGTSPVLSADEVGAIQDIWALILG
jgi:hypothetical protein